MSATDGTSGTARLHDRVASLLTENADLVAELRSSRTRIVDAMQRERRRLEQDLHDGAQQQLMAIQIKLRIAEQLAPDGDLAELLEEISADAALAVDELRMLARGIYPPVLRDFGPADALRAVAAGRPVAVRVIDRGIGRTSDPIEAAVYFCACEAIQNAAKHAGAGARVTVTLGRRQQTVELTIDDDGKGFTPEHESGEDPDRGDRCLIELQHHERDHDPEHAEQQLDPPVRGDLLKRRLGSETGAKRDLAVGGPALSLVGVCEPLACSIAQGT
jgi:signal transduction histidine kinase